MVELRYKGSHQPPHIVDVSPNMVGKLLKRGDYVLLSDGIIEVENKPNFEVPKDLLEGKWSEKQIKNWLELNQISIKYDIVNDEKKTKIEEIKKFFKIE